MPYRVQRALAGAPPLPTVTYYMSEVEPGAACRYRFW